MFDEIRLFYMFVDAAWDIVVGTEVHEEKENEVVDI